MPQPPQRELDVASAELNGVVQIAELAPVPDLDSAAVAALLLADAHPLRVVAVGTKRRGAGGTDPFAAALVPCFLLGKTPAQRLHQPFPAAERLDQLLLFLGQKPLGKFSEPSLGNFGHRI